jgi:hypothetical protein
MKTRGQTGHREDAGQVAALVPAWAVHSSVRASAAPRPTPMSSWMFARCPRLCYGVAIARIALIPHTEARYGCWHHRPASCLHP